MEETIELREIIEILLKGKWVVAISTIIAMLFAGVISWFVLDEQYDSHATIQISSGVQDTGVMSNFVAAEFNPTIYMKHLQNESLIKQAFNNANFGEYNKGNLSVTNQPNSDIVEVTYKGTTPEEAQKYLSTILNEAKTKMNSSVKQTLNQLEATYLNESNSISTEIELLMNSYNDIIISNNLPEVLILQTIASSQFVINLTENQTSALANINGKLQNELLQLKAQIDSKSNEYQNVLTKYQSVKTGLDSFSPDPFVRLIIEPTLEDNPAGPNKFLNLAIGLVLGLMLGIGIVFFREYWRNSTVAK